ncbi:MAG: dTDP-4-dehydrorhamnose 3,5-epimerase [Acidimicrobiales bacterium]|jgi:dTDP-4-dehydrorhamnose 3,5-epimerase|nr:dTDP-4-dehydrorhamnose 3,5-epimerase [Acidimicrobiales bacterium]
MEPLLLEPDVFTDERGHLFEAYNKDRFDSLLGHNVEFVQDNHSHSKRGVLRGLHYQLPPEEQGKLVRVVHGEVYDVAVDVRRSSPGYGEWQGHLLSADNRLQMWIPPGFAHGFLVLSETADVIYKLTAFHRPELARGIRWDDPSIGIEWPLAEGMPILSEKDAAAPSLAEAETLD